MRGRFLLYFPEGLSRSTAPLRASGPGLAAQPQIYQSSFLALRLSSGTRALSFVFMFSPSAARRPTMASADFSGRRRRSLSTTLVPLCGTPPEISPGIACADFHAYACHIYFRSFRARTGLRVFVPSHPLRLPRLWFPSVEPACWLQLPSGSASRPTPLLFG